MSYFEGFDQSIQSDELACIPPERGYEPMSDEEYWEWGEDIYATEPIHQRKDFKCSQMTN